MCLNMPLCVFLWGVVWEEYPQQTGRASLDLVLDAIVSHPTSVWWQLNLGPLKKKQALLTIELSL